MAFKPNYNQQRAERNRAKQLKKDEKLREQEEARIRRKNNPDGVDPTPAPAPDEPPAA
jgi:hypothetical protein